jgi:hypothetical protein
LTTLAILFLAFPSVATQKRDSIVVSLLTAWPGPEVYQLCGHSAIRIRGAEVDSVWNYGVFDFDEPNFVYRFVKGETDYMLVGYPTMWFMPEYLSEGRKVLEQDLNLTQDEAWKLRSLLQTEALPQNRTYRYNYVKDNCATRITDRLAQATDARLIFPDTIAYGTFRREMRAFHRDYPWYQFGIDLALGSGLDRELRANEEMFAPTVMSDRYAKATLSDGRRLVSDTRQLTPDSGHATMPATPWYLTPNFWSAICFILMAAFSVFMAWKRRILRWLYCLWFALIGLGGCIIAFLVFASDHEATSPNMLLLWLNPLQLIVAVCVWWPRTHWPVDIMAWYNIVVLGILLIIWPFQLQSANPAFFPLMGATLALSIVYAILDYKQSYNINSKIHNKTTKPKRQPAKRKR